MRSTFTKIFLSFWLTEFLIIICTIFILAHQFESNEVAYTSLFAMMQTNAQRSLDAYQSGGCKAMLTIPNVFPLDGPSPADQPALLFDPSGKALCQDVDEKIYAAVIKNIFKDGYLLGERHGPGYLEGIRVKDAHGQEFAYLVRGTYPKEVYIPYREELPRLVISLIVSVLVTFGITMVITRPIGSLREAARQLAAGNLRARAKWPKGKKNSESSDELWGLVYDFNHMADRLESVVDAQMLLLRDVSHELRSPLARLSVALELAREEAQPGMDEQLDRIEREAGRLNALIGQLLSLSHLESTKRLPDGQSVNLSDMVSELLPDMEYEAQGRNCHVSFVAAMSLEVHGSRELLGRAVENVIRNAIAYTAEGTSVEIELMREEFGGQPTALLAVQDHGPGVPEEGLKSIFRPFYRLDLSRQRSTGGYGVGLAIAERAIRLHGGEVLARNAAGGGLIVEMRLPLFATVVEADQPTSQRSTA
ncbi:ATP-binding protein [Acidicapsa ligni]|uniref:ATP-binding protein n=1 Tax=Acidicapsa ligni TaxID=542300 RepID=UPI0021E0E8F2|nr:ATP-binding protein [Acidicapsa ligni]